MSPGLRNKRKIFDLNFRPRQICFFVTLIVCVGCTNQLKPKVTQPTSNNRRDAVVEIANTKNVDRRGDIVFVHGLGSEDLSAFTCESTNFFFPEELGKELNDFGIWTVNYGAHVSDWLGETMPIVERSKNLLLQLKNHGIGDRPIVFVAHSMGGLIVKQMLRDSDSGGVNDYKDIALRTRGVVFIATPNAGSDLASALNMAEKYVTNLHGVFQLTVTAKELEKNAPALRDLNVWYRNNLQRLEIENLVFYESPIKGKVLVVDESSSDPGIPGIPLVRVDADHISICKPCDKSDIVFMSTKRFVDENVLPLPTKWSISMVDFLGEFNQVRRDDARLAAFVSEHKNQEVTWDAFILNASADRGNPTCAILPNEESPRSDIVIANVLPWHFKNFVPGTTLKISGVIKDNSNYQGAILKDCKVVPNSHH